MVVVSICLGWGGGGGRFVEDATRALICLARSRCHVGRYFPTKHRYSASWKVPAAAGRTHKTIHPNTRNRLRDERHLQ